MGMNNPGKVVAADFTQKRAPAQGSFFDGLRAEMEMRARILLGRGPTHREGRMTTDDLVHEAIAKMLANYDEASLRERPHNQMMALAYRTMRNLVIDEGRKKAALLETGRADDEGPGRALADRADTATPSAEEDLTARARKDAVASQLALLTPEERCFIMGVLETDSVPLAQKRCGWPPKSPYYVLKKLMDQLRGALAEWHPSA